MDTVRFTGGCWPTREQELLLQAALMQGKETIDAWEAWKSTVEIAQIDQGSYRLLPLLYKNLRDHGVEDPWADTLKGVYRSTWYKNQLLFRHQRIHGSIRIVMGRLRTERAVLCACPRLRVDNEAEVHPVAFEVTAHIVGRGQQLEHTLVGRRQYLDGLVAAEPVTAYHALGIAVEQFMSFHRGVLINLG